MAIKPQGIPKKHDTGYILYSLLVAGHKSMPSGINNQVSIALIMQSALLLVDIR